MFKYFLCFALAISTIPHVSPGPSQTDVQNIIKAYKSGESPEEILTMIKRQTSQQGEQRRSIKKPSNNAVIGFIIGASVSATIVVLSAASLYAYAHLANKQSQEKSKKQKEDVIALRKDFFKDVTGMTETEFKQRYLANDPEIMKMLQQKDGINVLVCGENTFNCGTLDQLSIQYLRQQCAGKNKPGGGKLNVIEGQSPRGDNTRFVDVGALQSNPAYQDAVFQVASNFNALEQTYADEDIEAKLVESYVGDKTQGPFASISAAPGLIYRRYFMFNNPNKDVSEWGQTKTGERQVNFLENICNDQTHVTMSQGGYVKLESAALTAPTKNNYENIKIGFHSKTDVTHGKVIDGQKHSKMGTVNTINQVFTAAPQLTIMGNLSEVQQEWANTILDAAYEGTLRSAFINDKKKVILTLIGGGVFGNKFENIGTSIAKMAPFIKESGLDVTLNWYDSERDFSNKNHFRQPESQKGVLNNKLGPIVKETGGIWTVIKENNPPQKIDLTK